MSWEKEFITDCDKLEFEVLRKKYSGIDPKSVTIEGLLKVARDEGDLEKFIDPVWAGDASDSEIYLLKTKENKFEVFATERGIKGWLTQHNDLEDAVRRKLELILNDLGFIPTDTRIK